MSPPPARRLPAATQPRARSSENQRGRPSPRASQETGSDAPRQPLAKRSFCGATRLWADITHGDHDGVKLHVQAGHPIVNQVHRFLLSRCWQ